MPDNLREIMQQASQSLPFMVGAAQAEANKVNVTRMLEAVIIAAIVGAGTWFLTIPELKTEFKYIKADIHEVSDQLKTLDNEVDDLKTQVAVERSRHGS